MKKFWVNVKKFRDILANYWGTFADVYDVNEIFVSKKGKNKEVWEKFEAYLKKKLSKR